MSARYGGEPCCNSNSMRAQGELNAIREVHWTRKKMSYFHLATVIWMVLSSFTVLKHCRVFIKVICW